MRNMLTEKETQTLANKYLLKLTYLLVFTRRSRRRPNNVSRLLGSYYENTSMQFT